MCNLMRWICRAAVVVFGILIAASPAVCDVRFVHDYSVNEYFVGEKKTDLTICYAGEGLYIDKVERLTSSLMKRFFGKEKEDRSTLHVLLDRDMIREFDYYKSKIYNYPLEKISDVAALRDQAEEYREMNEFLAARYRVKDPVFSLEVLPGKVMEQGYECTQVTVTLRLETEDIKKHARSLTDVTQKLWVSEAVPGYGEYAGFHRRLADRMGLEAERLGPLNYTLVYWKGSLEPIRDKLSRVTGYPVRSEVSVKGAYVEHTDTQAPKTSTMDVKQETMILKQVSLDPIDITALTPKEIFGVENVQ